MAEAPVTLGGVANVLRAADLLMELRGPEALVIRGVAQDSRRVAPGDLFLAWVGTSADGHAFVPDAAEAGAVAAVVERFLEVDLPQVLVTEGRRAAAAAAGAVLGAPWPGLLAVGVTGTNGKTTTALLARHLLEARGRAAAVGTLGVVDGDGPRPETEGLTSPGPVETARRLRDLAEEGFGSVVVEASSHALDQHRLDAVSFGIAAFTTFGRDHLDYHRAEAAYLAAKVRLAEMVDPSGILVVNADEPAWDALREGGRRVRTFSLEGRGDVGADDLELSADGSRFTLQAEEGRARVHLPLLGRFNVSNALAAASIALAAGVELGDVAERLATVPPVPGRLEVVHAGPFTVLVDFAHTPDALEGVLSALRPLTPGRLIVLFGAGGDRDRSKRRPMAEAVARYADEIVLTSDNPRTEDPESILDELARGLAGTRHHRDTDRRQGIEQALSLARPGDTVLLAGKGHERHQVVGTEHRPFDERAVVAELVGREGEGSRS
jgi:UDP-N-acetylmuramoyl-L-alanyl-D-glutamate--2,6-diaminopimelate ligase